MIDDARSSSPSGSGRKSVFSTASQRRFVGDIYSNVSSDVIEITHDKLENILLRFYQKHMLRFAWFNPLSILLALGLSISTSDFKASALGLDASTWRSFFMLIMLLSLAWLIISLIQLFRYWDKTSIEYLINRIKNAQT